MHKCIQNCHNIKLSKHLVSNKLYVYINYKRKGKPKFTCPFLAENTNIWIKNIVFFHSYDNMFSTGNNIVILSHQSPLTPGYNILAVTN